MNGNPCTAHVPTETVGQEQLFKITQKNDVQHPLMHNTEICIQE